MAKNQDIHVQFANILKWIGAGTLERDNLVRLKSVAEKQKISCSNSTDANFFIALWRLCAEFMQTEPNQANVVRNIDVVNNYLKSTSPAYIDMFRLGAAT